MRQYIGARYVPKFFEGSDGNNWVANLPYEALTIVTYYNASYTSKKPVPANIGNPADNPEYWVLTANFSGQLGELTRRVDSLDSDLESLAEITTSRKFIWIGDSYGMRNNPNWVTYAQSVLGGRSYAYSSYGFLPDGVTFLSLLQLAHNEETDPESVTDIVICGGWNDARALGNGSTNSQLQQAILECSNYIKTNFSNARMWIGFVGFQTKYRTQSGVSGGNLYEAALVYNGTNADNIRHLTACQYPLLFPDMLDDTFFHPNGNGGTQIGLCVVGELNGHYDFKRIKSHNKSEILLNPNVISDNFILSMAVFNGMIELNTSYFTVNGTINSGKILEFDTNNLPYPLVGEGTFMLGYIKGSGTHAGTQEEIDGTYLFYYNGSDIKLVYKGTNSYFTALNAGIKLFKSTTFTSVERFS